MIMNRELTSHDIMGAPSLIRVESLIINLALLVAELGACRRWTWSKHLDIVSDRPGGFSGYTIHPHDQFFNRHFRANASRDRANKFRILEPLSSRTVLLEQASVRLENHCWSREVGQISRNAMKNFEVEIGTHELTPMISARPVLCLCFPARNVDK